MLNFATILHKNKYDDIIVYCFMKLSKFLLYPIAAILFACVSLACSDDEKKEPVGSEYAGTYMGSEIVTGEWQGQQVLNATVDGEVCITKGKGNTLDITVPAIKGLVIEQMHFTINMASFTIKGAVVDNDGRLVADNYEVEGVVCDLGRGEGTYATTGSLSATYSDHLHLDYTFRLGTMPFPLAASYIGSRK